MSHQESLLKMLFVFPRWDIEDAFRFPKVGYVSSQEGNCFNIPESSTIYISKPFAEPAGEDDSMVAKKAT